MEPDEAKNNAHGFGYTLVVGKRHGLVQWHFNHLDKLSLPRLTSTWADAVVVRHLGVKHGLLGPSYAHARPDETNGKGKEKLLLSIFPILEWLIIVVQHLLIGYYWNVTGDQQKPVHSFSSDFLFD